MRIGRYKYVQYRSGARELYDFKRDPYEVHSRHLDPQYRKVKRWLRANLRRLERCFARTCKVQVEGKVPVPLPKPKPKPPPQQPNPGQQTG